MTPVMTRRHGNGREGLSPSAIGTVNPVETPCSMRRSSPATIFAVEGLCSGSFWATASGSLSSGFAEWVDARHYWRLLSSSDWTYSTHEDLSWVLGIWDGIRQLSHGQTVQSGGWVFWWGGSGLNGWEVRVVFRYNVFPGKALQEAEARFICRPPS